MKTLLSLVLVTACNVVFGQAGHIDTTFNGFPGNSGYSDRSTSQQHVRNITLQPDGKLLVAGQMYQYDGVENTDMVRINTDGTLDETFVFEGIGNTIFTTATRTDGKIYIGGEFDNYGPGGQHKGIGLVNPDGSPDSGFNSGYTGISDGGSVSDIVIQNDGDVLFAGRFSGYTWDNGGNATFCNIGKIHPDGTGNTTFTPVWNLDVSYRSIAVQPDGKIIAAGSIYDSGMTYCYLVRLNSDGTLDANLWGNNPPLGEIRDIELLPNGQVLVAGLFQQKIVLVNTDGSVDAGFSAVFQPGIASTAIYAEGINKILVQSDGKIVIGGNFATAAGIVTGFGRLNTNGSWDNTFNAGTGVHHSVVSTLAFSANGTILLGGPFELYNHTGRNYIAAVNSQGALTPDFEITGAGATIYSMLLRHDDEVLITGLFRSYQGIERNYVALLKPNGTLDQSFELDHNYSVPMAMAFQADNKLILCSSGMEDDYSTSNILMGRFNANGSIDTTFDVGTGPDFNNGQGAYGYVRTILPLSSGDMVVGGAFDSFNGSPVSFIARLNEDGSVDQAFNCMVNDYVWSIVAQPDGKMLIGGLFTTCNGVPHNGWARINPDGSNDESFHPAPISGYGFPVIQPDGKILISGPVYHAGVYSGITRLHSDGTEDTTFIPGAGGNMPPAGMLLQPDGKIVLYGNVNQYPGSPDNIVRLNADGTQDYSFFAENDLSANPVSGPYFGITSAVLQSSGRILVGGTFMNFDGVRRNNLAGLINDVSGFSDIVVTFTDIDDITCISGGTVTANCTGGAAPYTLEWNTTETTETISITEGGIYQVTVTDSLGNTGTAALLIGAPSTPDADLNANLFSTNFRPGFTTTTWINALNEGCTPVTGQLKLVCDTLADFFSTVPAVSAISGDTLIWDFADLTYDSAHLTPQIIFTTDVLAAIGDTINLTVIITPISGDADTTNNVKTYAFPVVNGYDPNVKSVYPVGKCAVGYVQPDQLLTYTVQFQNTGNSEAYNIAVVDSLDMDLGLNTVRIVGKSHELWTEVLPGNVLKFHFDDIHLADSTTDEEASHGYVIFEVQPMIALPHGTEINNKAEIFFDYNPAVVTNTIGNQVFNNGDLETYTCSGLGINEKPVAETITLYPNPTTGIFTLSFETEIQNGTLLINDLQGKEILRKTDLNGKQSAIDLSGANSGIYLVTISTPAGTTQLHISKL